MINQSEGSMDEITRIVNKAVDDDREVKRKGGYKGGLIPKPVSQKDQEMIKPIPIGYKVPEVISGITVPPSFEAERVVPAERFKKIEKSASDLQNQDPFKKV